MNNSMLFIRLAIAPMLLINLAACDGVPKKNSEIGHLNIPGHVNRKQNRLAHEKSPYLLQHAHNPVDWYPWGEEAFEAARRQDVPVFLSIGYSTCHWCHVMEHESFEDPEVAKLMNENFVCIKVDRVASK